MFCCQISLHSVVYSRDSVTSNLSLCLVEETIRVMERRCQGEENCHLVVSYSLLAGGSPSLDLACPDSVR